MSWSKPLYVLSHSKTVLRDALQRDASFLERNAIMDYSLLVGLDDKRNMLVLGIIGASESNTQRASFLYIYYSFSLRLYTHLYAG